MPEDDVPTSQQTNSVSIGARDYLLLRPSGFNLHCQCIKAIRLSDERRVDYGKGAIVSVLECGELP
jgi:hypothetical protein